MIVFLVRHAHAVDEAPGLPDEARHLTGEGRRAARQLGDRLRWYDCVPTAIWTSPAVRAVQTAELLSAGLGWDGPIETHLALAPGADVREVAAQLRRGSPDDHIVIVGHEPGISGLGSMLASRTDFPALRKAQVARLEDVAGLRGEATAPLSLRWVFSYGDDAPFAPAE